MKNVKMRYFDKYYALIDSWKVILCKETRLQIERINRFKKEYTFKQDEVDKRIGFIEEECSHTKGSNGKLKLSLPQKVWLESAWGFYYMEEVEKTDPDTLETYKVFEERRLTREVAIIVPRGTGKTTLGAAIGLVGQLIDGEYGADIQMLGYDRKQASYIYNAQRAMLTRTDSILYKLKQRNKLRSTKQGLLFTPTNALANISTSDYESLDGTNCHYNIFDEVHTYEDDFIKVTNDGSRTKRKNWMSWYISTQGTKREKTFDKYYEEWESILDGTIKNDHISIWIYKLDEIDEIHDKKMWFKAMPLLGITTRIEDIEREVIACKNNPVKQAELMAKTFNLPVNNYLSYFDNEECKGNKEEFKQELFQGDEFRNAYCVIGMDLSDVNDICAISFMIVDGDKRYFLTRKYLPRVRVNRLPKDRRDQYAEWEKDGNLIIHDLDLNDDAFIFEDIKAFMQEKHLYPVFVGYDSWQSKDIVRRFTEYYGDITYKVQQTTKVLSNPLKIYKAKIGAGKIIFDDPVGTWCHMNIKVKVDGNGNIFPNKEKAKDKIDVVLANLDAFIAYENNKENLEYYFQKEVLSEWPE